MYPIVLNYKKYGTRKREKRQPAFKILALFFYVTKNYQFHGLVIWKYDSYKNRSKYRGSISKV